MKPPVTSQRWPIKLPAAVPEASLTKISDQAPPASKRRFGVNLRAQIGAGGPAVALEHAVKRLRAIVEMLVPAEHADWKSGVNLRVSPAMALTCVPLRSPPSVLPLKLPPRTSIQASQSRDGAASGRVVLVTSLSSRA